MASDSGSQEPRTSPHSVWLTQKLASDELVPALTRDEEDRIADGEPYCFRCGRPASSFIAGAMMAQDDEPISPAEYVRREEGTYNPDTNRFACDACYIAIGMPVAPDGWRAP